MKISLQISKMKKLLMYISTRLMQLNLLKFSIEIICYQLLFMILMKLATLEHSMKNSFLHLMVTFHHHKHIN